MPEKPTISRRAKIEPEVRALMEGVVREFAEADSQELIKEIARCRLLIKEIEDKDLPTSLDVKHLTHQAQDLEGYVDVLRKDLLVAEDERKDLRASLDDEKLELEKECKTYKNKVTRLEESVKSVKTELARALKRERTSSRKGEGAESQRLDAQSKLEALGQEKGKLVEGLEAREVLLEEARARLEKSKEESEAELGRLRKDLSRLEGKLKQKAKSGPEDGKLAKKLRDAEAALRARQTALEAQAREMNRLRRQAGGADRQDDTIKALEGEINGAAVNMDALQKESDALRKRIAELEEGEGVPAGPGKELEPKLERLKAEAEKWHEAYQGKNDVSDPERRVLELEITLLNEESERKEETGKLRSRVKTLEREISTATEAEKHLRSDVEDITALAMVERESLITLQKELDEARKNPSASSASSEEGSVSGRHGAALRTQIEEMGKYAEGVISQGQRIEDSLERLRDTKDDDAATSKRLTALKGQSEEIASTLEEMSRSIEDEKSSASGRWSELEESVQSRREQEKELLERLAKIREDLSDTGNEESDSKSQDHQKP
ncbi:MAG: hypothetical protein O7H41_09160 [Planctomycetota bacterium]|nr:hypothetical protein [Planctomycetota bacterium]